MFQILTHYDNEGPNNLILEYKLTLYYLSAGISCLPVLGALQKKDRKTYKPSIILQMRGVLSLLA